MAEPLRILAIDGGGIRGIIPATVLVDLETRSGRPKSPLSVDKTTRVLRQALVWAEQNGLMAKAPLPEQVATH